MKCTSGATAEVNIRTGDVAQCIQIKYANSVYVNRAQQRREVVQPTPLAWESSLSNNDDDYDAPSI